MRINVNEIRIGYILEYKDRLWRVTSLDHVKPGKGGAFAQLELKDIVSGTKLNERLRTEETVERAILEELDYQYLYKEGNQFVFMNNETFEQEVFDVEALDGKEGFLQDSMVVSVAFYDSKALWVTLPEAIISEVVEAEASIKGQTAAASYKPAMIQNGIKVMVPPFVTVGEKIVVKTKDSTYVERAK